MPQCSPLVAPISLSSGKLTRTYTSTTGRSASLAVIGVWVKGTKEKKGSKFGAVRKIVKGKDVKSGQTLSHLLYYTCRSMGG